MKDYNPPGILMINYHYISCVVLFVATKLYCGDYSFVVILTYPSYSIPIHGFVPTSLDCLSFDIPFFLN